VLTARIDKEQLHVSFVPTLESSEPLDIHYAILGFEQYTRIPRGENEGKTLRHDFVAMKHHQAQLIASDDQLSHHITLALPRATAILSVKKAIAIWVTKHDHPTPIQVTGDWLVHQL